MSDATERTSAIAKVTLHAATADQPTLTAGEVEGIVDGCKRAATWVAGTAYVIGAMIRPITPNGHYYRAVQGGTSGTTEPTWPKGRQSQVQDGLSDPVLIWEEAGQEKSSIYNVSLAIHQAWQLKAARAAQLVRLEGQNYQMVYEHCLEMARDSAPLDFN